MKIIGIDAGTSNIKIIAIDEQGQITNKEIFKDITLPLLKPTIYFVTLITAISSFQVFDLIYVLTSGGPNDATNVLVYSIYKYAFEYFDIGKSCALAYILFFIIFILALLQKKLVKE